MYADANILFDLDLQLAHMDPVNAKTRLFSALNRALAQYAQYSVVLLLSV